MYEQIIVVGGSNLILYCCQSIRKSFQGKMTVLYTDNSIPDNLRNVFKNLEIEYQVCNRTRLMDYVEMQREKTLVFSIMNPYLFKKEIVQKPELTIVNLHHGILPGHRGRNATAWAIFLEEPEIGISWCYVDEGIDTGKVICVRKTENNNEMTSLTAFRLQNKMAVSSLEDILPDLLKDKIVLEQRVLGKDYLHKSVERPNGGYLDIEWSEHKISAFLRAMDYGALEVLGKPKLMYKGKVYTWKRYKICNQSRDQQKCQIQIEATQIQINKAGYQFVLMGIQELESH